MKRYVYAASFDPAGDGEGIYGFRWLPHRRKLEPLGVVAAGVANPLCLVVSPCQEYLYVGDCTSDWRSGGAVFAYRIDPATGALEARNVVDSAGIIPVYLSIADDGRHVLVANCGPFAAGNEGRTVAVFPVKAKGLLGPAKTVQQHEGTSVDPERQTSPHPHCIALDPENKYVWVPDLGTDSIWCYSYDRRLGGLLHLSDKTVHVPQNSGPRVMKFHPSGEFAYLLNEIANTVMTYRYESGSLTQLQILPALPRDVEDRNAADLVIHPGGRHLYTSNRQQNCISVFNINAASGELTLKDQVSTQGALPRGIALDKSGAFLLAGNEATDTIQGFRVGNDGGLADLGTFAEMPGPACLTFVQI